jgi:hypothetical protein
LGLSAVKMITSPVYQRQPQRIGPVPAPRLGEVLFGEVGLPVHEHLLAHADLPVPPVANPCCNRPLSAKLAHNFGAFGKATLRRDFIGGNVGSVSARHSATLRLRDEPAGALKVCVSMSNITRILNDALAALNNKDLKRAEELFKREVVPVILIFS